MKALLDEKGFIISYALVGDLVDGIDLPDQRTLLTLRSISPHTRCVTALLPLTANKTKHSYLRLKRTSSVCAGKRSVFL